jgi:hypothetical protein
MKKHLGMFALVALLCGLLVPMGTAGDKDKKKARFSDAGAVVGEHNLAVF